MSSKTFAASDPTLAALDGIPQIDFPSNLDAAFAAGRRMTSILAEAIALRRGVGRILPNEF